MRKARQVMQLLLLACAGFALVCVGLFALQLVKTTKQVQADVTAARGGLETTLGKVNGTLDAATARANELKPVIKKLAGTVDKLNNAADQYAKVAATLNQELPTSFGKLNASLDQFAAAGEALNDPQKGIKGTLQNANAILLQVGIAGGEAAQASIAQRKQLDDGAKKIQSVLDDAVKAMADGRKFMDNLVNPKKAPMWLQIVQVILGKTVQGGAAGAASR